MTLQMPTPEDVVCERRWTYDEINELWHKKWDQTLRDIYSDWRESAIRAYGGEIPDDDARSEIASFAVEETLWHQFLSGYEPEGSEEHRIVLFDESLFRMHRFNAGDWHKYSQEFVKKESKRMKKKHRKTLKAYREAFIRRGHKFADQKAYWRLMNFQS